MCMSGRSQPVTVGPKQSQALREWSQNWDLVLGGALVIAKTSRHHVGPPRRSTSQPLTQTTLFHEQEAPDQSGR